METGQSVDDRLTGELYRHLFKHMPICIFVVNLAATPRVILEMNRRAELIYGYTSAELVGKPSDQLVPQESLVSIENIVLRVQRGEIVTTKTTNRRRDGTTFPVRVIAVLDPDNHDHMIIITEDITAEIQYRSEEEAIDAERLRIAHEIHDGVAQSLAGLRFKSAQWSHLAEKTSPVMRAALDELQAVLVVAIVDIRRAIFTLRPVDLESLGFLAALLQLVNDFGDQNQISAQLNVLGSQDSLPISYELPLFRIIQQGLNNIHQHAHANSVFVSLDVDVTRGITVSVRDNGCGFDPSQVGTDDHAGHFGLRQMRERILDLGGTLDIRSAIGQGTELFITVPALLNDANHVAS